jgi:hypothetical protein
MVDAKLTVTRFVKPLAPLAGTALQPASGQTGAVDSAVAQPSAPGRPALASPGGPGAISPSLLPPDRPKRVENGQAASQKLFPAVKEADPLSLLNRKK